MKVLVVQRMVSGIHHWIVLYENFLIGLVTATFAASLITSPAIGAHLSRLYSENFIIALG